MYGNGGGKLQRNIFVFFLFFLCVMKDVTATTAEEVNDVIWAVENDVISLPCPLSPERRNDKAALILWFKTPHPDAFYTFDARNRNFELGDRWYDSKTIGKRAFFVVKSEPPSLKIDPVKSTDHGIFTCRIDYRRSPSSYHVLNLTVIIPPGRPRIFWQGNEILTSYNSIGPVMQDDLVEIKCETSGGRPAPAVTWWKSGQQLQATSGFENGIAWSLLNIKASRDILKVPLLCHAIVFHPKPPTNLKPRTTAITINVTLPPLDVRIIGMKNPITAGTTIVLECRAVGSHPKADITWWKGDKRLSQVTTTVLNGGNISSSSVTFEPTYLDDGITVSCTASNPSLPKHILSDSATFNVYYAPDVQLSFGEHFDNQELLEGQDVFFECKFRANPPPDRFEWYHEGQWIEPGSGAVVNNNVLIIQNLIRNQSGAYNCAVINKQGRTQSNTVHLTVKYSPVCASGFDTTSANRTIGATLGDKITVPCYVEANPSDPVRFTWRKVHDDDKIQEIPEPKKIESQGLTSYLSLTLFHPSDYGTLLCWANNSIGAQKNPCVITVVPAGPPDPPRKCKSVANQFDADMSEMGSNSIQDYPGQTITLNILCIEGFDGGFPQSFWLQAWQEEVLIANMTSEFPDWQLKGLSAGTCVKLKIVSFNARGLSDPITLDAITTPNPGVELLRPDSAEKKGEQSDWVMPLLGGVSGAFVVLVALFIAILFFVGRRRQRKVEHRKNSRSGRSHGFGSDSTEAPSSDPDVVSSIQYSRRSPPSDTEIDMLVHSPEPGGTPVECRKIKRSHTSSQIRTQATTDSDSALESEDESESTMLTGTPGPKLSISTSVLHHYTLPNTAGYTPIALARCPNQEYMSIHTGHLISP